MGSFTTRHCDPVSFNKLQPTLYPGRIWTTEPPLSFRTTVTTRNLIVLLSKLLGMLTKTPISRTLFEVELEPDDVIRSVALRSGRII